jgi:2-polyprenyl-3-methyl-5-hydroxy-6-metoxy-1,4-benzoquinol methylase
MASALAVPAARMDEQKDQIMTTLLDRKAANVRDHLPTYALGYSTDEFRRLELQGAFFRDLTEDVLRRAGIDSGMRVLDVGCGVGDVALLAGEFVGPTGSVLGIDRSHEGIEIARRRAAAAGQHWTLFEASEIETYATPQRFDAIVGRLVLGYMPDAPAALRRLTELLRPGGVAAFQEIALPLIRSVPPGPLFGRCSEWVTRAFGPAGFEIDMGGKLHATFVDAGLGTPQMIAAGRVGGGAGSPLYDYMAGVVRSLLPMIERFGVATADEVGIETLAERLRQEALASNACIMLPPLVGAWARRA